MKQSRFKSKVLWASIAGQIMLILNTFKILTPDTNSKLNIVIPSILSILVIFGVINNPTNSDGL